MAGIYIHIPFCSRKCAYCDFYSVASNKFQANFVTSLEKELLLQKDYLGEELIETIYFGGGTPSLLNKTQIDSILECIYKNYNLKKSLEITLEANPENLEETYLKEIHDLGINRLSIGIQSFSDMDLLLMKRKHSVTEAKKAVHNAQKMGFSNISVDLIYGLPDMNLLAWEKNIDEAMKLNIQHISAYHLTIEPNTYFFKQHQKQKLNLPSEIESLEQLKLLKEKTAQNGFLHYEISNFALDGSISLHNTNYWMGVKYLGLGPSAHSYNLSSRQWNIQNLGEYMRSISQGKVPYQMEILTANEKYNDFVITSLRTMWGLNVEKLELIYGVKYKDRFLSKSKKYLEKKLLIENNKNYILTEKGIYISDSIMQDLFID